MGEVEEYLAQTRRGYCKRLGMAYGQKAQNLLELEWRGAGECDWGERNVEFVNWSP